MKLDTVLANLTSVEFIAFLLGLLFVRLIALFKLGFEPSLGQLPSLLSINERRSSVILSERSERRIPLLPAVQS